VRADAATCPGVHAPGAEYSDGYSSMIDAYLHVHSIPSNLLFNSIPSFVTSLNLACAFNSISSFIQFHPILCHLLRPDAAIVATADKDGCHYELSINWEGAFVACATQHMTGLPLSILEVRARAGVSGYKSQTLTLTLTLTPLPAPRRSVSFGHPACITVSSYIYIYIYILLYRYIPLSPAIAHYILYILLYPTISHISHHIPPYPTISHRINNQISPKILSRGRGGGPTSNLYCTTQRPRTRLVTPPQSSEAAGHNGVAPLDPRS